MKALQQAQKNVEEYFPVVGMLEHWNCTLQVLEQRLLPFFGGVRTMYFDDLSGTEMEGRGELNSMFMWRD